MLEMYLVKDGERRELSPREFEAVLEYGIRIVDAFPAEGPTGQRYVASAS